VKLDEKLVRFTGQWVVSRTRDVAPTHNSRDCVRRRRVARKDGELRLQQQLRRAKPSVQGRPPASSRESTCKRPRTRSATRGIPEQPGVECGTRPGGSTPLRLRGHACRTWTVEPGFEIELPRQTETSAFRYWRWFERFEGLEFRHSSAMVVRPVGVAVVAGASALYNWGTGINYYPAEGLAPFLADSQEVEAGLTVRRDVTSARRRVVSLLAAGTRRRGRRLQQPHSSHAGELSGQPPS